MKDVYHEYWDDYQLKSIQIGGNKMFIDYMREYDLLDEALSKKYTHPATQWY